MNNSLTKMRENLDARLRKFAGHLNLEKYPEGIDYNFFCGKDKYRNWTEFLEQQETEKKVLDEESNNLFRMKEGRFLWLTQERIAREDELKNDPAAQELRDKWNELYRRGERYINSLKMIYVDLSLLSEEIRYTTIYAQGVIDAVMRGGVSLDASAFLDERYRDVSDSFYSEMTPLTKRGYSSVYTAQIHQEYDLEKVPYQQIIHSIGLKLPPVFLRKMFRDIADNLIGNNNLEMLAEKS